MIKMVYTILATVRLVVLPYCCNVVAVVSDSIIRDLKTILLDFSIRLADGRYWRIRM